MRAGVAGSAPLATVPRLPPASLTWPYAVFGVSGVLLALLLVFKTANFQHWAPNNLFGIVNLSAELNAAAWWSSTLLLVAAVCAWHLAVENKAQARAAWAVVALMLGLLSLDEVGSLHERFASFGTHQRLVGLFVFGIILAAAGLYAAFRLVIDYVTRSAGLHLLVAGFLFSLVVLQEFIEHDVSWPLWTIGARATLEEGTELVAFYLLLRGLLPLAGEGLRAHWSALLPKPPDGKSASVVLMLGLALHCALAIAYVPTLDDIGLRGDPGAWYPMAVYLLIAGGVVRLPRLALWSRLLLVGMLVVSSLAMVVDAHRFWPLSVVTPSFVVAYYLQLAILAALSWCTLGWRPSSAWALLVVAVLPAFAGWAPHPGEADLFVGVAAFLYAQHFMPSIQRDIDTALQGPDAPFTQEEEGDVRSTA